MGLSKDDRRQRRGTYTSTSTLNMITSLRLVMTIVQLSGLYKGAQSPLYMATFYSAVLFVTYGQAKRIFHDPTEDEPNNPHFPLREMIFIGTVTSSVYFYTNDFDRGMYILKF